MMFLRIQRWYSILLATILVGVVLHAPLTVFLTMHFPEYDLLIKSWKEILMIALIPIALILVMHYKLTSQLRDDWLIRLITAFALLHLILAIVIWQGSAPFLAGLAIDLRFLLFFGLVYIAVLVQPPARRSLLIAVGIGACIVTGFAVLQLFLPADILTHLGYSKQTIAPYLTVDENPAFIRINSTLRGPNPLGAYAGMVLGLLGALWVRGKLAVRARYIKVGAGIVASGAIIALWLSYSRSALVAGVVTVLIVLGVSFIGRLTRRVWIAASILLFALAGGLLAARDTSFVSNVFFHENPVEGSSISSNEGHVESLAYGFTQLFSEPFGSGVGSTGSASLLGDAPVIVENHYLFVAHEAGWLSLGLFLGIFVIVMRRLWHRRTDWLALGVFASGIGLSLIGLLLPVWTDDTVSITWWALAAIAVAGGKYARNQTK